MTMKILEPQVPATHSMIWLHGLGASNQDMYDLAAGLGIENLPIRHVCLQAPNRAVTINQSMSMPAWYDIVGTSLTDREDRAGIYDSEQIIIKAIEHQLEQGISSANIFIAGFSQGGAMALHASLKYPQFLAGAIALSCYLPLAGDFSPCQRKTFPIFLAYGENDPIVWPSWTEDSHAKLAKAGFKRIKLNKYPMMHEVSLDEMRDLRQWIFERINLN